MAFVTQPSVSTGRAQNNHALRHTCRAWTRQLAWGLRGWVFRDGVPELRARKAAPRRGARGGVAGFHVLAVLPESGWGAVDLLRVSRVRSAQPDVRVRIGIPSPSQSVVGMERCGHDRSGLTHLGATPRGSPGVACRYRRERRPAAPELITQPWAGDDLGGNGSPRHADHRRPR